MKAPATTIPNQPWMNDPGLHAIMGALNDAGAPPQALMVGGAVRNALMGIPVQDIDIATVHTPENVMKRLETGGIRHVPTGLKHGTITAVVDKKPYEITTLRRDVATDGRHAEVAFSTEWNEDAERRDFTINTLLMDLSGQVYDPLGRGMDDLKARSVRFVGDPDRRIAEDYLRILRFFRFHAHYGQGEPDADGLAACKRGASNIANLSRERVTHEFERLLLAPEAASVIAVMISAGILSDLIRRDFDADVYHRIQTIIAECGVSELDSKTLFAYSVWQNNAEEVLSVCEKSLSLSNAKKDFMKQVISLAAKSLQVKHKLYRFGKAVTLAETILSSISKDKNASVEKLCSELKKIAAMPIPVFPISAGDLMKTLGLKEGKDLGDLFKKTESWWLDNDTIPDRAACIKYAKNISKP